MALTSVERWVVIVVLGIGFGLEFSSKYSLAGPLPIPLSRSLSIPSTGSIAGAEMIPYSVFDRAYRHRALALAPLTASALGQVFGLSSVVAEEGASVGENMLTLQSYVNEHPDLERRIQIPASTQIETPQGIRLMKREEMIAGTANSITQSQNVDNILTMVTDLAGAGEDAGVLSAQTSRNTDAENLPEDLENSKRLLKQVQDEVSVSPFFGSSAPTESDRIALAPFSTIVPTSGTPSQFGICNPQSIFGAGKGYDYAVGSSLSPRTVNSRSLFENGIMKNFDFPLKPYMGCVKNQQQRGTCTAFSTASTIETRFTAMTGLFTDLSKQAMFFEGANIMNQMGINGGYLNLSKDSNVFFPFETTWNYNPTQAQMAGYTETYSPQPSWWPGGDWGQAKAVCTMTPNGQTLCGYLTQSSVPLASGIRIKDFASIWDFNNIEGSLQSAILYLQTGYPLILSATLTGTWDCRSPYQMACATNGYVFPDAQTAVLGGHAMAVVGYIAKADYQRVISSPALPSDAKGVFIIKNSWDTDAGDSGYYYMSDTYFKKNAFVLEAITDVESDIKKVVLQSYDSRGWYVSNQNLTGRIMTDPIPPSQVEDLFFMVPGLVGQGTVSFLSFNHPGYYLKNSNVSVNLELNNGTLAFKQESSFFMQEGLADPNARSFESYSQPNYYLRHSQTGNLDYRLYLSKFTSATDIAKATFLVQEVTN